MVRKSSLHGAQRVASAREIRIVFDVESATLAIFKPVEFSDQNGSELKYIDKNIYKNDSLNELKVLNKTLANQINNVQKELHTMTKWDLFYVHKAISIFKNQ